MSKIKTKCQKLNLSERKFLLELARRAIGSRIWNLESRIKNIEIGKKLKERRACFVTLTIDGELRGCIGHLEPVQELYQDVIENAKAAAFEDPRFPPLSVEELKKIKIEISVLDKPKKFEYQTAEELVDYLGKNRPGVILSKGWNRATFLPQVWEEIPEASEFLGHLCLKAGLNKDEWQKGVEIQVCGVEKFEED